MSLIRRTKLTILVSCLTLMVGTQVVFAAAPEGRDDASSLQITGALSYKARIALPRDAIAIVELSDPSVPGGRLVAEHRSALDGRQVPIPFEIVVERAALLPDQPYLVRGAVLSAGLAAWITDEVPLDPSVESPDLGTVMMRPYEPPPLSSELVCGDQPIRVGFLEDRMRLQVDDRAFDLRQAVSGSGARYVALADPSTSFWSKGDRGMLEIAGTAYPECIPVESAQTAFRATGNEPFWSLELTDKRVDLNTDMGETRINVALTEQELLEDGRRYRNLIEDGDMVVSIFDRPCVDSMSGMPHPATVEIQLDERRLDGCGGDPATLLQGPEWIVEDIGGGGIIDRSRVTLNFGADGRLWGRASCNAYQGEYTLTGETLTLALSATTMMACAPALMDQERKVLDLLARIRAFELDPTGALILKADDGRTLSARRDY
ncbi:META domain-containing protein [Thiocapsa roseopersicina]|uniref:Heat shock protein HslJ n=1 Tax=Thiocapsa roseopersicina TaxID=1058 RepID=A0A1H2X5J3_THIRO|nr:META domain-containing protein [Thiocapsa roseopersicina]SDW88057.1 Heat shock protein HslJ [Thiocapsa roseopersicina]